MKGKLVVTDVAFVEPSASVVPTLSTEFEVKLPNTSKEVLMVAVVASSAFVKIPAAKVSKTLAVSGVDLFKYKASASSRVSAVDVVKKDGLKSIVLKFGLGAVLVSAITYT